MTRVSFDKSLTSVTLKGVGCGIVIPVSYIDIAEDAERFNFSGDTEKLKKEIEFNTPRWESMLHGFGKMIPNMFSGFLQPSAVVIDPQCTLYTVDGVEYEVPPYNKRQPATVFVHFDYTCQNRGQLINLREILSQSMKSPLLYNRCFASVDIYDHDYPRARIAVSVFDTLDAQLKLFESQEGLDFLVEEFREKLRSHLAGVATLEQHIRRATSQFK